MSYNYQQPQQNYYQQPQQNYYQPPPPQQNPGQPQQATGQYGGYNQQHYQQQQGHYQHGHHQQQQYHAPPPAVSGYNTTGGGAVVGQQYLVQHPTTLILSEDTMSFSRDDFSITDNSGRPWFKLDAKTWSMGQKRTLLDNQSRPILLLSKNIFSFGTKWQASDPNGNRLLYSVEPKIFSWKPHINIFLNDGDREPDFKVSGSMMKRDFQIFDKRNGGKRLIASCSKQRPYQSAEAFLSHMFGSDRYYLQIEPNTDAAFCVSLCLLLDELYNDKK